jgi:hypothetical protein
MITLATDFGDPYPAAMKGVVARRFADADAPVPRLVDVSHRFPRQDVRSAAFWLRFVLPEFPPAVHCVVVDPGVGTDRAALVVRAGEHALVGPDNGVLLPAARALAGADCDAATDPTAGIEPFEVAVEDPDSHTFHGRDVFAPVAADVHRAGVADLDRLPALSRTGDVDPLSFPEPTVDGDGAAGEVLVVDEFGNVVTNVPGGVLDGREGTTVAVGTPDGTVTAPVARSYARVGSGDRLVTVGSHGNVELAVNRGRGDEAFGVAARDRIDLAFG